MSFFCQLLFATSCSINFDILTILQARFSGKTESPYVGEDAENKRGALALKYPVEFGFISNMDDMELILSYTFYDRLGICQGDHPVLMSQVPFNPKSTREKVTEIMFEQFEVPAFCIQTSAVLALFSVGSTSGVAIELGGGVFNASVVNSGTFLRNASLTLPISGRCITDYLRQDVNKNQSVSDEQKWYTNSTCFWNTLNDMKHTCCFVSQDFYSDNKNPEAHALNYELPDGTYLTLDKERYCCPEAIFNPNLYGVEMQGIQHQAYNAAMKADTGNEKEVLSNMVLCGGGSLFPGLPTRLESELKKLNTTEHDIRLVTPDQRENCVWRGGSLMAVDEAWGHIWMNKEDYDEHGPTFIHNKSS